MEKGPWLRDLIFYIISSVVVLLYGAVGFINFGMALGFLMLYIIYMAIVIYVG